MTQGEATLSSPQQPGGSSSTGDNSGGESTFSTLFGTIARGILFYYLFQTLLGTFGPKPSTTTDKPAASENAEESLDSASKTPLYNSLVNKWSFGTPLDLYVYFTENESIDYLLDRPVWFEEGIIYGDFNEDLKTMVTVIPTESVQKNGSLYLHVLFAQHKVSPNPSSPNYDFTRTIISSKQFIKYLPRPKIIKKKKLVSSDEALAKEESSIENKIDDSYISYWTKNLTINIVADEKPIPYSSLPEFIKEDIRVENPLADKSSKQVGFHYPVVFINEFWTTAQHIMPINETVKELPIHLNFYPISFLKYQLYRQMDNSFQIQKTSLGTSTSEIDEIKRMLIETNSILLAVTLIVSLLHSIFDFLAFKNDIQFWKEKEDLSGLSIRSILLNVFIQFIIFLYLCDNSQTTSWMILFSQGIGVVIEMWKIKKAVDIKLEWSAQGIPRIHWENKASYTESKTKEYDDDAFRYLSYVIYPLMVCYTIYSLMYEEHKGWYSFILGTMVGFVYTFGFIMMTPQLFINYKLKSVAHMPWKTFMYKALNTVVDDLFAFVIKMPFLHRLACFRDDIIFVIYLYQKWIYPVDHSRRNEYGQVGEKSKENEQVSSANSEKESKKDK